MKGKLKVVESISVEEFYDSFKDELKLHLVAGEKGLKSHIREKSINRPSLVLTGFYKYFAAKRIQLFGAGEMGYMRELVEERQRAVLKEMVARKFPV